MPIGLALIGLQVVPGLIDFNSSFKSVQHFLQVFLTLKCHVLKSSMYTGGEGRSPLAPPEIYGQRLKSGVI